VTQIATIEPKGSKRVIKRPNKSMA